MIQQFSSGIGSLARDALKDLRGQLANCKADADGLECYVLFKDVDDSRVAKPLLGVMDCKAVAQAAKDDIEKVLGGASTGWSEILQKAATDLESHCPAWQPTVGSLASTENTKLVLQLVQIRTI